MPDRPTIPLPLPKPTPLTQPFWDAAKQRKLLLPRDSAGRYFFYPRPIAPGSMDDQLDWGEVDPSGTIYSFTIDRRGTAPAFVGQVPYVIAIVELDAGPHLTTNIIGCEVDDVRVGMRVEAVFEDVSDEITLIKFTPTRS
jgi:uncharacterized OB-fold protein